MKEYNLRNMCNTKYEEEDACTQIALKKYEETETKEDSAFFWHFEARISSKYY
jgi:hypothetical protein